MGINFKDLWDKAKEVRENVEDIATGAFEDLVETVDLAVDIPGNIWKVVSSFFAQGFTQVWRDFSTIFGNLTDKAEVFFSMQWLFIDDDEIEQVVDDMFKSFDFNPEMEKILRNLIHNAKGVRSIIIILIISGFYLSTVLNFIQMGLVEINQDTAQKTRPNIPDPGSIMRAAFLDKSHVQPVREAMARLGFSEDYINLMFVAQYAVYNEDKIREIHFREQKPESWSDDRLSELGFTADRITELKSVWKRIPPIQDILMMMAKEAFEPDMIATFGLDQAQPGELSEWLGKHGIDPKWANAYWVSHWQPPSLTIMLEAFHRGKMTSDELYKYMSLVEIPPRMRDIVRDIAYSPYTRVDIRRMHDMGVVNDEELLQGYMDLGYDENKAGKLVEWTKLYNTDTEKELSRKDIEKGYEDGDLDFNLCIQLMGKIGYREEIAGYYLSRIDLEKDRAARLDEIEFIKEQYLSNLLTDNETINALVHATVNAGRRDELIARWRVQKRLNVKLPSKTDLNKFLQHEIIDDPTYVAEMVNLGYQRKYISWFLNLAKAGLTGE